MSLKVWLPLNGDLKNKGSSGLTFSNINSANTTVNSAGKIGKCYNNNSHSAGGLLSNKTISLGQNQSMFCWFKFTDLESSSSLGGGLVSQHRYSSNTGMGITIKYVSSTTGYLSVNTGNGSGRTYNTYCGTTLLQANTWYHGGYTYDGTNIRIYVNGICEKIQAYSNMSVPADYLTVFCWSMSGTSGNSVHGDYKLNGFINDVRIYDHCLSQQEIRELANGLVLHYKLDTPINLVENSNTYSGWSIASGWTISNGVASFSRTGATSNNWVRLIPTLQLDPNQYPSGITISFDLLTPDVSAINQKCLGSLQIYKSDGGRVGWVEPAWNLSSVTNNVWTRISQSFSQAELKRISSSGYTVNDVSYTMVSFQLVQNGNISIRNIQVESGNIAHYYSPYINNNIVYDSSGYNHNGTIIGTLLLDNSPLRYQMGTTFDENNDSIIIPSYLNINQTLTEITVSCWFKTNTMNSTAPNIFSLGSNSFLRCRLASATSIWSYYRLISTQVSDTYTCKTVTDNIWHLLTFTFKNGVERVYIDGLQIGTTDRSGSGTYLTCASTDWFLAGYTANSENFIGSLSDFRIYCTALTAQQILDLYKNEASIDSKGNIYARELVEE